MNVYIYIGVYTTPMGYGKITASFTRATVTKWIDKQWNTLVKLYPEYDGDPDHRVNGVYGGKKGYSEFGAFTLKIYRVKII